MKNFRIIPTVPQEDREKLNEGGYYKITPTELLKKINEISNKILKGNGNTFVIFPPNINLNTDDFENV